MYNQKKHALVYTPSKYCSCFRLSFSGYPASVLLWTPSTSGGAWTFPTSLLPFKGSHDNENEALGKEVGEEKISACTSRVPPASYSPSFVLWRGISPLTRENKFVVSVVLSMLPSPPLRWWHFGPGTPSWHLPATESQFWTRLTPWLPWPLSCPTSPKPSFKNAVLRRWLASSE